MSGGRITVTRRHTGRYYIGMDQKAFGDFLLLIELLYPGDQGEESDLQETRDRLYWAMNDAADSFERTKASDSQTTNSSK